MKTQQPLLLLLLWAVLSGCSNLRPFDEMNFAGSGPLFKLIDYSDLTLCKQLTRFGLAKDGSGSTGKQPSCKIKSAINPTSDKEAVMRKRNNFAGYIMALSDLRCGFYKQELLAERAGFSIAAQSVATIFAGAGSVITHGPTANVFSAASGVASGVNAAYQQERFANLTVEVITAGIDSRRNVIRDEVRNRYGEDLVTYPVGDAVRDVMAYHAACTAVTGMEVAQESIVRTDNPGLREFQAVNKALKQYNGQWPSFDIGTSVEDKEYTEGVRIPTLTLPMAVAGNELTYSISPDLPAGLSFSADTRQVEGTPKAPSANKEYDYTASDPVGSKAGLSFSIAVKERVNPYFDSSRSVENQQYTVGTEVRTPTLPEAVGDNGLTYSISPGLPSGLLFDESDRRITGTPTAQQDKKKYKYSASDAAGTEAVLHFHITVSPNEDDEP